jgi:hypothetical protein
LEPIGKLSKDFKTDGHKMGTISRPAGAIRLAFFNPNAGRKRRTPI